MADNEEQFNDNGGDPLGILTAPKSSVSNSDPLGILKKKDVSQPSSVGGGQSSQLPLPAQLPSDVPQTPNEVFKAGISGNGVQPVNAPQAAEQAAQQQPLIKPVVNNGQHFLQGIGQAITQTVNPNTHGVKPAKSEANKETEPPLHTEIKTD